MVNFLTVSILFISITSTASQHRTSGNQKVSKKDTTGAALERKSESGNRSDKTGEKVYKVRKSESGSSTKPDEKAQSASKKATSRVAHKRKRDKRLSTSDEEAQSVSDQGTTGATLETKRKRDHRSDKPGKKARKVSDQGSSKVVSYLEMQNELLKRVIFNKELYFPQETVNNFMKSKNLHPNAANIFKGLFIALVGILDQEPAAVPIECMQELIEARADICVKAMENAKMEFLQVACFAFPDKLYEEAFDSFMNSGFYGIILKRVEKKDDMEFVLRKVLLFFMLGEIQKNEWRRKNEDRTSYHLPCLKAHSENFPTKIDEFNIAAKVFIKDFSASKKEEMKKAIRYIKKIQECIKLLHKDDRTFRIKYYKGKLSSLLFALCVLTNASKDTVKLFKKPFEHIPITYKFKKLLSNKITSIRKRRGNVNKSAKEIDLQISVEMGEYFKNYKKILKDLNENTENSVKFFPEFFAYINKDEEKDIIIKNDMCITLIKNDEKELDGIKKNFTPDLQGKLIELLYVVLFELKVIGSLDVADFSSLKKEFNFKKVKRYRAMEYIYACLFRNPSSKSKEMKPEKIIASKKRVKVEYKQVLSKSTFKKINGILFDFYELLRGSIDHLSKNGIIIKTAAKCEQKLFISLKEASNDYTNLNAFPFQNDCWENYENFNSALAHIPHYNFTLPLLQFRELLRKLHSNNPRKWNKKTDLNKLETIAFILYGRVSDYEETKPAKVSKDNATKNPKQAPSEKISQILISEFEVSRSENLDRKQQMASENIKKILFEVFKEINEESNKAADKKQRGGANENRPTTSKKGAGSGSAQEDEKSETGEKLVSKKFVSAIVTYAKKYRKSLLTQIKTRNPTKKKTKADLTQ